METGIRQLTADEISCRKYFASTKLVEGVRMNLRRVIAFAFVLLLAMGALHAMAHAAGDSNDYAAADAQILNEIHERSEAMENLEHLSDAIGARLTGSPQLKQA